MRPSLLHQLTICHQMAEALQHVHEHDRVHGDFKPENILLEKNGQAVLNDFGLSYDAAAPPAGWT